MKPVTNATSRAFYRTTALRGFVGERIKGLRDTPLSPGGRVALTLFEAAPDGERLHPRLRTDIPPVADPHSSPLLAAPPPLPADATAFEAWLRDAITKAKPALEATDGRRAPAGSEEYFSRSLRVQRRARLFAEVQAALTEWEAKGALPPAKLDGCFFALRAVADEQLIGIHDFDDSDTGTYHSFEHDNPFVHYLEAILASLPEEGTEAFSLHDGDQQESIRRQRRQATAHLDFLMRHKYANEGIRETDIERSLGGFLIDAKTRRVASEDPASRDSLVPRHQLLRIEPGASHPQAGAWIYRDGAGFRLQDGTPVEVEEAMLRATPVEPEELTFRRAPRDPLLRAGIRFDWDGNGYVQAGKVGWVDWAGHCDIKAIAESLGVTMADRPTVWEYRSDTGITTIFDRKLLLEMFASILELGSLYDKADGSGTLSRGIHRFGGARNDSRPDRLQFTGLGPGKSFRWPLEGRQETFRVTSIHEGDQEVGLDRAFFRWLPTATGLDLEKNDRFLATIEGDYNLINASGTRLGVRVLADVFDPKTGYPKQESREVEIDLAATSGRIWLGTSMKDAAAREIYEVWFMPDPTAPRIEADLSRWERKEGQYAAVPQPAGTIKIPLQPPLKVTLSREMKRDDPASFQALLDVALRQGQNICADTDMAAEVWNGVVKQLEVRRLAEDRSTRVSRWQVDLSARFGKASLDYLVQRDARGEPLRYTPMVGEEERTKQPDFLWQDFPDVASKGLEEGEWVINHEMADRGIVETRHDPRVEGEVYVFDDHIKNVYEILFCGLGEHRWTLVHGNKRYGFKTDAAWRKAVARLERLRTKLKYAE